MHFFTPTLITSAPLLVSHVEIDCDPAAERLQVFDRVTGALIKHLPVVLNKNISFLTATKYSDSQVLMCVLLDDSQEFNAAIQDNVQATLVDLFSFDPANPLPYEPPSA